MKGGDVKVERVREEQWGKGGDKEENVEKVRQGEK